MTSSGLVRSRSSKSTGSELLSPSSSRRSMSSYMITTREATVLARVAPGVLSTSTMDRAQMTQLAVVVMGHASRRGMQAMHTCSC